MQDRCGQLGRGLVRLLAVNGPFLGNRPKNGALICRIRHDLPGPKGKGRRISDPHRRILLGGGLSGTPSRGLDQAGSRPARS